MQEINIKEEVYKCSKCGLCKSVCPVFLAVENEKYLPRGRFNILNNFFNNNKPLSEKFIDDLDVCLNCNACKNFCPSNIDSVSIFTVLKSKYKKTILPFFIKYKFILLMEFIKNIFRKIRLSNKKNYKLLKKTTNVAYFEGCYNRYINPSDKNASIELLKRNGYNPVKIIHYCCGLPYLSDGNVKNFEANSKKIINSIPKDVKYVVSSCDSCYKTLAPIFKNTQIKLVRLADIIDKMKQEQNAFFFKPFSLEKYDGNLPLINRRGACSLMENFFILKHKDISQKLLEKVFFTKEEIEGKTIVTSCNLSKWGLIKG